MPLADNSSYSSPNWSPRSGRPIRMLVVHATAGTVRGSLNWLSTPLSQTSAHYLVDKSGRIYQLVPEERMAWHAGGCRWKEISDVDDVSIGIELENANTGFDPYPDEQIAALLELARAIVAAYAIDPEYVVRHADIASPPGSEIDPAGFPWERFITQLFPGYRPLQQQPFPLPHLIPTSLEDACREVTYRHVGVAYRPGWAVFRIASRLGLGSPISEHFQVSAGGRTFIVQPFARDVLFAPLGEWEAARRLSQLSGGRESLELHAVIAHELYRRAGGASRPGDDVQDYAERELLGPPLQAGLSISAAGRRYEAAIYALEVLYRPADTRQELGRLNILTRGMFERRPPQLSREELALRTELLVQLFRRAGAGYHEQWALHQRAIQWNLGAPLSHPVRCSYDGRDYIAQPFALDVLYSPGGDWSHIYRTTRQ